MYSWILPIHNEAQSIPQLITEINKAMKGKKVEIIAVDDASTDHSLKILNHLKKSHPSLFVISFPTRQGKWASLTRGFQKSRGETIILSDADLQDDPREISKLLKKLSGGFDLVSGIRSPRRDPFYKIFFSRVGNHLTALLQMGHFRDFSSPFKVAKREVFQTIPTQGSFLRYSPLLAQKMGFKVTETPTIHRPRLYGKSKFGPVKYLRIIYDLVLVRLLFTGSGRLGQK